ncbi:unnamed protein product [Amoebophrya sp. A120]|nr:unnamed protein product [Amoebophrya sp. A120]|eukprot:GSA120T00019887001.1
MQRCNYNRVGDPPFTKLSAAEKLYQLEIINARSGMIKSGNFTHYDYEPELGTDETVRRNLESIQQSGFASRLQAQIELDKSFAERTLVLQQQLLNLHAFQLYSRAAGGNAVGASKVATAGAAATGETIAASTTAGAASAVTMPAAPVATTTRTSSKGGGSKYNSGAGGGMKWASTSASYNNSAGKGAAGYNNHDYYGYGCNVAGVSSKGYNYGGGHHAVNTGPITKGTTGGGSYHNSYYNTNTGLYSTAAAVHHHDHTSGNYGGGDLHYGGGNGAAAAAYGSYYGGDLHGGTSGGGLHQYGTAGGDYAINATTGSTAAASAYYHSQYHAGAAASTAAALSATRTYSSHSQASNTGVGGQGAAAAAAQHQADSSSSAAGGAVDTSAAINPLTTVPQAHPMVPPPVQKHAPPPPPPKSKEDSDENSSPKKAESMKKKQPNNPKAASVTGIPPTNTGIIKQLSQSLDQQKLIKQTTNVCLNTISPTELQKLLKKNGNPLSLSTNSVDFIKQKGGDSFVEPSPLDMKIAQSSDPRMKALREKVAKSNDPSLHQLKQHIQVMDASFGKKESPKVVERKDYTKIQMEKEKMRKSGRLVSNAASKSKKTGSGSASTSAVLAAPPSHKSGASTTTNRKATSNSAATGTTTTSTTKRSSTNNTAATSAGTTTTSKKKTSEQRASDLKKSKTAALNTTAVATKKTTGAAASSNAASSEHQSNLISPSSGRGEAAELSAASSSQSDAGKSSPSQESSGACSSDDKSPVSQVDSHDKSPSQQSYTSLNQTTDEEIIESPKQEQGSCGGKSSSELLESCGRNRIDETESNYPVTQKSVSAPPAGAGPPSCTSTTTANNTRTTTSTTAPGKQEAMQSDPEQLQLNTTATKKFISRKNSTIKASPLGASISTKASPLDCTKSSPLGTTDCFSADDLLTVTKSSPDPLTTTCKTVLIHNSDEKLIFNDVVVTPDLLEGEGTKSSKKQPVVMKTTPTPKKVLVLPDSPVAPRVIHAKTSTQSSAPASGSSAAAAAATSSHHQNFLGITVAATASIEMKNAFHDPVVLSSSGTTTGEKAVFLQEGQEPDQHTTEPHNLVPEDEASSKTCGANTTTGGQTTSASSQAEMKPQRRLVLNRTRSPNYGSAEIKSVDGNENVMSLVETMRSREEAVEKEAPAALTTAAVEPEAAAAADSTTTTTTSPSDEMKLDELQVLDSLQSEVRKESEVRTIVGDASAVATEVLPQIDDQLRYSGVLKRFMKEHGHGFLRCRELYAQTGRDVYVRLQDLPKSGEGVAIGQVFEFNVVGSAMKYGQLRATNISPKATLPIPASTSAGAKGNGKKVALWMGTRRKGSFACDSDEGSCSNSSPERPPIQQHRIGNYYGLTQSYESYYTAQYAASARQNAAQLQQQQQLHHAQQQQNMNHSNVSASYQKHTFQPNSRKNSISMTSSAEEFVPSKYHSYNGEEHKYGASKYGGGNSSHLHHNSWSSYNRAAAGSSNHGSAAATAAATNNSGNAADHYMSSASSAFYGYNASWDLSDSWDSAYNYAGSGAGGAAGASATVAAAAAAAAVAASTTRTVTTSTTEGHATSTASTNQLAESGILVRATSTGGASSYTMEHDTSFTGGVFDQQLRAV